MVMDLIVLGILVVTTLICTWIGFARTLIGFLKGIASIVVSWILSKPVSALLANKTALKTNMSNTIAKFFSGKLDDSKFYESLPDLFKGENGILNLDKINNSIDSASSAIAGILITIICFFIILVVIRLVLAIVAAKFKNADKDSKVAKVDRKMGSILGFILGLLIVCLFMMLLVPTVSLVLPAKLDVVMGWFDKALISRWLYDHNLLLWLIQILV